MNHFLLSTIEPCSVKFQHDFGKTHFILARIQRAYETSENKSNSKVQQKLRSCWALQ